MQEQYVQLQNYLVTLFDSFQIVSIKQKTSGEVINSLIQQNITYGKKIIQLSQKFDQLYQQNNQPYLNKLFSLSYPQVHIIPSCQQIFQILSKQLKNVGGFSNLKQSKKSIRKGNQNNQIKQSTNKKISNISGKGTSAKQTLAIRQFFQQQELVFRQIYEYLQRIFQKFQLRLGQKTKFTKSFYELDQITAGNLVKVSVDTSKLNLRKIQKMVQYIVESAEKWQKNQGQGQNRISLYLKQISRRQEVFSYAVSKLLQNLKSLKVNITNHQQQKLLKNTESLQQLIKKLFEIYPSANILKDINQQNYYDKNINKSSFKVLQYINNTKQVQVNIKQKKKDIHSEKIQLDLFKFCNKITQNIKKFELNIKNKRQIQSRQVQKLLQNIKQNLQYKPRFNNDIEIIRFQQHLKQIQNQYAQRQKQYKNNLQKIIKKNQKILKDSQDQIQNIKAQNLKSQQKITKINKKLQNQKSQNAKLKTIIETNQKVIHKLEYQCQNLKQSIKSEQKQIQKVSKLAKSEHQLLLKQKQKQQQDYKSLLLNLQEQHQKLDEERGIYKSKIRLLEQKQAQFEQNDKKLKQQLEQMILDNQLLKNKFEQLNQLYQQKINQNQQLLDQFKRNQQQLNEKQLLFKQLQISQLANKQLLQTLQNELQHKKSLIQKIQYQRDRFQEQSNKFRQLGRLNQDDIQVLREQIQKVKQTYLQSQQQLQQMKIEYHKIEQINKVLQKKSEIIQKNNSSKFYHLQQQIQTLRISNKKLQDKLKTVTEDLYKKQREHFQIQKTLENYITSGEKGNKQNIELKTTLTHLSLQLMNSKQQLERLKSSYQNSKGNQSKHILEIQTLKIQIKNLRQTTQKQRMNYQREKSLLNQKIVQLNQLIHQKQLLTNKMRISRHQN